MAKRLLLSGLTYADLVAQLEALKTYCDVAGDRPVFVLLDPERHKLPVPVPLLRIGFNEEAVLLVVDDLLS